MILWIFQGYNTSRVIPITSPSSTSKKNKKKTKQNKKQLKQLERENSRK